MRQKVVFVIGLIVAAAMHVGANTRIAVLTPERSPFSERYAESLEASLEDGFRVLDRGLAASAYRSLKVESPFNQTRESAKKIGTLLGCDHFILLKAETLRRSSSARPNYFEASAFIFLIDSRSGRLEKFLLPAKQAETAAAAENALAGDTDAVAASISAIVEINNEDPQIEYEMFDPESKSIRPAMPYRRIKPEYTSTAFHYDVQATVDAEVSIDDKGTVQKIDIVRWAGFGLDDAVIEAVNKMVWRAGERNGKPLPMRVLLRYNFTKIEKEPQ